MENFFKSLQNKIGDFFAPSPDGVRVRDVVREVPGQTFEVGKEIARSFPRFGATVGNVVVNAPFKALGVENQNLPFPQDDQGRFIPTGTAQKFVFGTRPIGFRSEGESLLTSFGAEESTARKFGLPLGFALVALDAPLPGTNTIKRIVKSKNIPEIFSLLKKTYGQASDDLLESMARRLADETSETVVRKELTNLRNLGEDMARKTDPTKQRKFIDTLKKSDNTAPEVADDLFGRYSPIKNKETLEQAKVIVNENIDEALRMAKSPDQPTALDNAVAQVLMQKRQGEALALKATDPAGARAIFDEVIDIAENVARRATTQGQAIQSLSMWNRLDPEGMILYTQRRINRVNKKLPPNKHIKLTDDITEKIVEGTTKIKTITDPEERMVETAVLLKKIDDMFPTATGRKIATLQTMFQLLNPKTFIRNIGGNSIFGVAENVKDFPAVVFDSAIGLATGKRTIGAPSFSTQAEGFYQGFKDGMRDALKGIDTTGLKTQFDIPRDKVFKGSEALGLTYQSNPARAAISDALDYAEVGLNVALRAPDRAFYQAAYDGSIYKQMKARGIKNIEDITDDMKEIAHFEGLYRTFQDENATTAVFTGLKKVLNKAPFLNISGGEFGIGDIILKYPRTPANLLNRGLAYSPLGFVNALFELNRVFVGKDLKSNKFLFDSIAQKKAANSFARATVGSGVMFGVGATLFEMGIISTTREDDSDVATLKREIGLGEYKLNASALKRFVMSGFDAEQANLQKGDKLVTYDWAQPMSLSLAIGADFAKNKGSDVSMLGTAADAVKSGVDTLAEQPLVSGFANLFKYGEPSDALGKALEAIPSSFVPTFFSQVRQLIDNTARTTYDPSPITYSINRAKARIPFVSETLPDRPGVFGDPMQTYPSGNNNFFNVFFNPAFISTYDPTPEAKLVLDLYEQTGETKQFPRYTGKKVTVNGKRYELNQSQIVDFQRYIGTVTKELFSSYANDPRFMQLPAEEQIKEMQSTLTAIGSAGKIIILGDRPTRKPSSKTQFLLQQFQLQNNR